MYNPFYYHQYINSNRSLSSNAIIGTAWVGHHVILLRCNPFNNQLLSLEKSSAAPMEPVSPSCAETLSRLLSIGYKIVNSTMVSATEIQYILVKNSH